MLEPPGGSARELLLGLRFYSTESRFILRPEQLPGRVLEVCVFTYLVTLLVFYAWQEEEDGEDQDGGGPWRFPSIAYAGATAPSSLPYTLGLHLAALLLSFAAWCLHATQAKKLSWNSARRMPDEYYEAKVWSRRCLWLGLAFAILLALAASAPATDSHSPQQYIASATFLVGTLYAGLLVRCVLRTARKLFVVSTEEERDYALKKWTALLAVLLLMVHAVILLLGGLKVLPSGVDCDFPDACPLGIARTVTSYGLSLALMVFVFSLRHDLKGVSLELNL